MSLLCLKPFHFLISFRMKFRLCKWPHLTPFLLLALSLTAFLHSLSRSQRIDFLSVLWMNHALPSPLEPAVFVSFSLYPCAGQLLLSLQAWVQTCAFFLKKQNLNHVLKKSIYFLQSQFQYLLSKQSFLYVRTTLKALQLVFLTLASLHNPFCTQSQVWDLKM